MYKKILGIQSIENDFYHWLCSTKSLKYDVTYNDDGSITVAPWKVPTYKEREALARQILRDINIPRTFFFQDGVTICVILISNGIDKIGYAICKDTDRYSEAIGKAIALERARYGRVVHEDLLGMED